MKEPNRHFPSFKDENGETANLQENMHRCLKQIRITNLLFLISALQYVQSFIIYHSKVEA